jgi:hypothetical protein
MKQRPQHLISEFAKKGFECHYIDLNYDRKGVQNFNFVKEIEENVYLHPHGTKPWEVNCDILYCSYPPPGADFLRNRRPDYVIYDLVDDFNSQLFSFWNMGGAAETMLREADLVTCTAKNLMETAKKYNDNVILVPNACDYNHFNKVEPIPDEIPKGKPIVGFFGAFADWIDKELIVEAAKLYPQYNFVLIGANFGSGIDFRKSPSNLYNLGYIPYPDLPKYVQSFNVGLIPFKSDMEEAIHANPIKMYEYFSLGIPVVSTEIPETNIDGVYWSNDNFLYNIGLAVKEDSAGDELNRRMTALDNTWAIRAETILKEIDV